MFLKSSTKDNIQQEVDIYKKLNLLPGIPLIFGWCLFGETFSYISMEPFDQDLYHYVQNRGPTSLKQACEIAGKIVRGNPLSFVRDQLISLCT